MKVRHLGVLSVLLAVSVTVSSSAQESGGARTPLGGEKQGGKDVPEWKAEDVQLPGWSYGKARQAYFKYKDDKPVATVDAGNVDQYTQHLTPGQIALIKQTKGYKMPIYPAHRYCSAPDFVVENTKKNASVAKLGADGWTLAEATVPGIPFAAPKSGIEVMYNAKMRYRGVGQDIKNMNTAVSPRKGSSEWITAGAQQTLFYPWAVKGATLLSSLQGVEFYTYFSYSSPAALAGQAVISTLFLNQPGSETFYYFPGQRRVRRMPSYAYDSPQIGMENQYTLDEPQVFNGTLDRFDWKLAGKKEIYVPYDSFFGTHFDVKFNDFAKDDFIDERVRRYELHRVWVVEATVKSGVRHLTPKRTFYVDEDSWNIVLADDYDAQGKLWKHREGHVIPVYETSSCDIAGMVQYNLIEGRYLTDTSALGAGKDMRWITDPKDNNRMSPSFFSADNLRAISDR